MVLITGAEGFLGSHLLTRLREAGLTPCVLRYGDKAEAGKYSWTGDISCKEHIELLKKTKHNIDVVIHLAGKIDIALQANPVSPEDIPISGYEDIFSLYLNNVVGAANVLDFCLHKKVKHLIFASSQTVYGFPSNSYISEESISKPLEHYAASKLCAENIFKLGSEQGLDVTVLRIPGIYCETRLNGIVYSFCKSALLSRKIKANINFPLPLDVIYIDDVVDALEKSLYYKAKGWNCMNIATGEKCSANLLADSIAELVPNCKVEYSQIPQPIICLDSAKAYEKLGWKAVPRKERLRLMLNAISRVEGII